MQKGIAEVVPDEAPLTDCYLEVVGELVCFHDPESYTGWDFNIPGRFNHAGQVKG